jgi:hypothetical protein|tara:strand:- start:3768 stop:4172 length:405 start_codon:yes stop_codon:yes gene_type:complete
MEDLSKYIVNGANTGAVNRVKNDFNVRSEEYNGLVKAINIRRAQTTGTTVDFISDKIYNTAAVPGTGNILIQPVKAILGIVQKLYHNDGSSPTITGVSDVQIIGTGVYTINVLNIIYFEWTAEDRVEYWVTQEG